jgi:site-specific recombinase XerD
MSDALKKVAELLTGGRRAAGEIQWANLSYAEVQAVRSQLADRYAPATANKILSAIRGVAREAWRLGLMDAETYRRIDDVESVKGQSLPPGRALSAGEIRALFDACRADKFRAAGTRDAAILALLYAAGLRRGEIVALGLQDYDSETGSLKVRRGKGRKDRIGYCANGSKAALDDWLRQRGTTPGPLFVGVTQGGNVVHHQLSDDVVWHVVRKRAAQAEVKAFGPHSLRRTFITHLLELGVDVGTVQRLAGHANVQTTLRYDHRGEKVKQRAVELLHVPWHETT